MEESFNFQDKTYLDNVFSAPMTYYLGNFFADEVSNLLDHQQSDQIRQVIVFSAEADLEYAKTIR